jgi:hypothetical protein
MSAYKIMLCVNNIREKKKGSLVQGDLIKGHVT